MNDGVESAVEQAKAAAGKGWVGVGGANIAQQCLDAGLLDEVRVNLVPILLGRGIRYFDNLSNAPVMLEGPEVIEGHARNPSHLPRSECRERPGRSDQAVSRHPTRVPEGGTG